MNLDVCEDGNAHCINGRCECEFGYTEEQNMCGRFIVSLLIVRIFVRSLSQQREIWLSIETLQAGHLSSIDKNVGP